jgi:N-acetylneuraminic acid mutarotase
MNTDDRFDDELRDRLRADAPREAPSGLLDATMSRIAGTQQRSGRWFGAPASRLLAVAAVAVLAVLAGTQLAGLIGRQAGIGPSPSVLVVPSESPEPSPTVAPSTSPIPPSPTPSASSSPAAAAAWTATGSMIKALSGPATLLTDGKVLVAGGGGGLNPVASAELYEPSSGSWTATGNMNGIRSGHTATLLPDGKVLAAGGADRIGFGGASVNALASAELYDPSSGSWTATGSMQEVRSHHTATLLPDGKVLVVGGSGSRSGSGTGYDALSTAELYDPASGSWTATGNLNEARTYHTATLLPDGSVLVVGGLNSAGSSLASAELYDPSSGSWTVTGQLIDARVNHTATLLPDGKVLVVGGNPTPESPAFLASAELYDPNSGSWTATGGMIEARQGHLAALLRDGTVLVAGGSGGPLASAERYDPSIGSWIATASMLESRTASTATVLRDGTVLVAGGYGGGIGALASAELYAPGGGN